MGVGKFAVTRDGFEKHLRDVDDLDLALFLGAVGLCRRAVGEHDAAERAARRDLLRIGRQCLVDTVDVDALADGLFHPHARAAGAAAHRALPVAGHLAELRARSVHELARGLVDLVVATEEAGVVVGDVLAHRRHRHESLLPYKTVEQLRVVDHLVLAAERPVLVLQRVEAMRAGDDDLAVGLRDTVERVVDGLDVLLREHLEQELVARATGGVAGTGFALAEHRVGHAGRVQQRGDRLRRLLRAILEGAGTADPEQVLGVAEVLDILADDRHVEVECLGPVKASALVLAPRVALVLEVLEQARELGREVRLQEHLVAAHVDDVVDVLDIDRALLDARTAVGAGPQRLGVDNSGSGDVTLDGFADEGTLSLDTRGLGDRGEFRLVRVALGVDEADLFAHLLLAAGEQVRRLRVAVVAQRHDEQLRRQRLGRVPRRALRLAAATLGTGGEVEPALPREVLDRADAELRLRSVLLLGHLLDLFHGEGFAVLRHRLDGAERRAALGIALRIDVEERGEAVPGDAPGDVAADDVQPHHAREQLDEREDRDHQLVGREDLRQRTGDEVRGPVEVVTLGGLQRELARLDEHHAQALEEDDCLDEVRRAHVRTGEARDARAAVRVVLLANADEDEDADHGAETEELVDEVVDRQVGQPRPARVRVERLDVGLEPDDRAEKEADHHHPVEDAHRTDPDHARMRDEFLDQRGEAREEGQPTVIAVLLAKPNGVDHSERTAKEGPPTEQTDDGPDSAEGDSHR